MLIHSIDTREDLKRQIAKLGMVLWSLSLSQRVPDRERLLSLGLEVCDTVSELISAVNQGLQYRPPTYEEAAFLEHFCDYSEAPSPNINGLKEHKIDEKVGMLRVTIERLLHFEKVSREELERSSEFCHLVYAAI